MENAGDRRFERFALATLLVVAFVGRWWLLGARWVNPDEGAHLMDGRLALQGLIPGFDFGSRQVLYVYLNALALKLFGLDYVHARLLAVGCTLATGVLLYLIGRTLFDRNVGLLAAALYLLLPFPFLLSMNAKTEPPSILFAAGAIWATIAGLRRADAVRWAGVLAGVLLAAAFYTRESALGVVLACGLVLLFGYWMRWGKLARAAAWTAVGFAAVCVAVMGIYWIVVGTPMLDNPSFNPLAFVLHNLGALNPSAMLGGNESTAPVVETAQTYLAPVHTARNIAEAVRLVLVLAVGATLAVVPAVRAFLGRNAPRAEGAPGPHAFLVPFAWIVGVGLAYGFWAVRRGFFQAYYLELLPSMALLAAWVALDSIRSLRGRREGWTDLLVVAGVVLVLWVAPTLAGIRELNGPVYITATLLAVGVTYLWRPGRGRVWGVSVAVVAGATMVTVLVAPSLPGLLRAPLYLVLWAVALGAVLAAAPSTEPTERPGGRPVLALALYPVLLTGLLLTLVADRRILSVRYDGVWSPETVQRVSSILRARARPHDEVLSGAVIWALQSDLDPFDDISHPLAFADEMDEEDQEAVGAAFHEHPPAFIVLDGYTERTYLRHLQSITDAIATDYELLETVPGSRFPVMVYRRAEPSAEGGPISR